MAEPLECIRLGCPPDTADILLVLCHGRGAVADDLADWAGRLVTGFISSKAAPRVAVLLPKGPTREGIGRGWWEVPADLKPTMDTSQWAPPDDLVCRVCATVQGVFSVGDKRPFLVVGGFSQGAVLATYCVAKLCQVEAVGGLCVLSSVLDVRVLKLAGSAKWRLHVFIAHGDGDALAPKALALAGVASARRSAAHLDVRTHFHEEGHVLGEGTDEALAEWLLDASAAYSAASASSGGAEFSVAPSAASPAISGTGQRRKGGFSAAISNADAESRPVSVSGAARSEPRRGKFSSRLAQQTPPPHGSPIDIAPIMSDDVEIVAPPTPTVVEPEAFCVGDAVRLTDMRTLPHLQGARATLVALDGTACLWEVEVKSTGEKVFVTPERLQRFVSETERRAARALASGASPEQLAELRSIHIDAAYDHPALLSILWSYPDSACDANELSATQAQTVVPAEAVDIGGVPCLVFGDGSSSADATLTVLLFGGGARLRGPALEELGLAYAESLGAKVIAPLGQAKLSTLLSEARAVSNAVGNGSLIVHGTGIGSVSAVQIAAERSQAGQVSLLVLESAVASLRLVPGAQALLGCMALDPLGQSAKLRLARCSVALVDGPLRTEAVQELTEACHSLPKVLRADSAVAERRLLPELIAAALQSSPE